MDRKQTDSLREDSKLPTSCALWPVDLKLTRTDCDPGNTLVHFQGQYATTCELDYNILQVEIQDVPKTSVSVEVGDLCLVEDLLSNHWYRGRVQKKSKDLFDVFLLDYGKTLVVGAHHFSAIPDSLLILPPKIFCGFIANVLPFQQRWDQPSEAYFSSLIGRYIEGYIHGLLPYKVLILEVPEITKDLLSLGLGRYVDTDTFLFLAELVLEVPIQQSCESVPDLLIKKQTALEISFKFSNLCDYENSLSLCGSKFTVGETERVRISAAVNPGLFYCQLSSATEDLKEMSEKLALVYESKSGGDDKDKPEGNMGLLCAVKGKDEKWHRGLIQCLPVNSQIRVVFIDYGYFESVKVENIFQLPTEFLLRPFMAFPCSLSCLGGRDKDTVNYQQLGLLRKGLLGTELVITIDDLSKEKCVCLVTFSDVDETPRCKEADKMAGCGTVTNVHRSTYITSEAIKVEVSKGAFKDIQDGAVFEGYIEHVQSPHEFWMRSAKSNDRFEAMMNKLDSWFNRLQLNEKILQDPVPGQLCCAMYEKDMHYYRAVVVDIVKYGAEVFFIDFGNTEKVPSMLIKKIPTEFTVEPVFAFKCSLAHVVPLDDEWTTAATDLFRKASSDKAFLVHVIDRKSDVMVVEMFEKGFRESQSIATFLTSANMAMYWTYKAMKPLGTPVGKKNKTDTNNRLARRQFSGNSYKSMATKLPTKVTRQEINKCVDKQIQTETKHINDGDIFKVHKFKPGAVLSVQCSHISSPSDFWCQNKQYKSDLDSLMERLQRFYQTNTSVSQPQGLCCAVQLQLDKKWYRGCIFEEANSTVKVILVDCGIVVQEQLQKLRALSPEFLELEGQAFRCSLYNLTNPFGGDAWSDVATILLKDFTSRNTDLKCQIYSQVYVANKGFCNMVDLCTPFQRASTHLIERGFAKEIQHPKRLFPPVYPCSFVYSSLGVTIGSEELVFPTHVINPWEIYLQLDRNTEIIEQLVDRVMKESEELISQTQTKPETAHAWPSVCLAKYSEDGKWYRSFVWPAQSSLYVNVFFVDYGGKEVVEKNNVLSMPMKAADLLLTPMQALRCSLLNIPEEEHLPEVNTWLEKAILNKGLRAKFAATNSSGDFICDLFDGDLHINEKVRELFANHRRNGKSVSKPISSCSKEVSSVANKFKTNFGPHVESVVKSKRTSGHNKVIKRNEQSCQKILSNVESRQISYNLNGIPAKNCCGKDNHKPTKQLQKETGTISKVQPFKLLPNLGDLPAIKMAPGSRCIGFISHCDSVKSFFIQMEKDEQNILKMRKGLNSSPFTESLQRVASNVKVGHLVAARYDKDLALYRAVVISVASGGFLTVEFVDYGNMATVNREKIYPLASNFLSQARLSTRCTLSKPHDQGNIESLISGTSDKPLVVEFVQNLGYAWEVSIQGLNPWHKSRKSDPAKEANLSYSDQAEPSRKRYAAVDEDDASLTSTCGMTEAETSSIKGDIKRLEHVIKESKVVQEKTLEKEQFKRAGGSVQKLQTGKKARTYEYENDKQDDSPQKLDKDINLPTNDLLNISKHPAPTALSPTHKDDHVEDNEIRRDNQIQRLIFAPLQQDHEYSGFAAAVTTPGKFYVVLDNLLLNMMAVLNVLEELSEDLAPLPDAHLIPGSGCLVKSEKPNKWCRAEVIQRDPNSVIVNLVDYGYCVRLAFQDVRRFKALPVELAGFPKVTYPCLLRGIEPVDGLQWSDQAALYFQQCICHSNLQIHFRQRVSEAQWAVDVITANKNVAKELVAAGHAQYTDPVLRVRFHLGLGRKISRSVENSDKAVTQSTMEKVPLRNWEETPAKDDDIPGGCSAKEETKVPSVKTPMNTDQQRRHDVETTGGSRLH